MQTCGKWVGFFSEGGPDPPSPLGGDSHPPCPQHKAPPQWYSALLEERFRLPKIGQNCCHEGKEHKEEKIIRNIAKITKIYQIWSENVFCRKNPLWLQWRFKCCSVLGQEVWICWKNLWFFWKRFRKYFILIFQTLKNLCFVSLSFCSSSFSSSIFYQMKIQMQSNRRYHRIWFACAEFMLLVFEHFPRLWRHWGLAPVSRRHRTCFPRSTWTEVCSTVQSCWDDYAPGLNQILSARRKALT